MEENIKNMLRLFLQSIMEYEQESGSAICYDEREDTEFVDIFIDSSDAFDYETVTKHIDQLEAENKRFKDGNTDLNIELDLKRGKIKELKEKIKRVEDSLISDDEINKKAIRLTPEPIEQNYMRLGAKLIRDLTLKALKDE